MKKMFLMVFAISAFALPVSVDAAAWKIDPDHSNVQFQVTHMMISDVRGNFPAFQGRVVLDEEDITRSTVEVSIEAASIDTRHAKRDAHLKSPDFFDVEKYPVITFKSNKITRGSAGTFEVVGALTLHGVTRDVELTVSGPSQSMKDPWGNIRKGVRATTQVNRKDFDLTWNKALETGGVLVGESIDIVIELELIQQKG